MLDEQPQVQGQGRAAVTGFPQQPLFEHADHRGRWYTPAEAASHARVAVIAENLARTTGTHVGDRVTLQTAAGPASFRVIGMTSSQWNNGTQLLRAAADGEAAPPYRDTVNGYFDPDDQPRPRARSTGRRPGSKTGSPPAATPSARWSSTQASRPTSARTGRSAPRSPILGLLVVAISMVGLSTRSR